MPQAVRCASAAWRRQLAGCLLVLVGAPPVLAGISAFEDAQGGWVITDGPGESGWRLLFTTGEHAARTVPPRSLAPGACGVDGRARGAEWHAHVESLAAGVGVDPNLVRAVIWAESRCNPRARSAKGAQGLMQLMPATAREYGATDPYDPLQNIRAGAHYLGDLLRLFSGNTELALAAYNAGPRSVLDARMRIPPFRETRAYVPAVLARAAVLAGRP